MATIKIRGKREPVQIERTRALALKNRHLGINNEKKRDPNDSFDLGEGQPSYKYGQIDWIDPNEGEAKGSVKKNHVFENHELEKFEKGLLKKYLNNNNELTLDRELQFLADEKTINLVRHKDVIKTISDCDMSIIAGNIQMYKLYSEKISAWKDQIHDPRCIAEKKRLQQYEDMHTNSEE